MDAVILVDIQNDFLPGGALAVPAGDEVIDVANAAMEKVSLVVATQDWHPHDHASFASQHIDKQPGDVIKLDGLQQVLWPDHCVQGTSGAEFAEELHLDGITRAFRKGSNRLIDSYSGFFDNGHRQATGLGEYLKEQNVNSIAVMGLATDYCVKFTALDAVELGFDVALILEGCRGVNLQNGDVDRAVSEMEQAGVNIVTLAEI